MVDTLKKLGGRVDPSFQNCDSKIGILMSVRLIFKRLFAMRMGADFRQLDVLLLVLFAMLGALGFSRFPSYQDLTTVLDDFSRWWILVVLAFNILLISKILRKCFLEEWLALVAAALFVVVFSLTTVLLSLAMIELKLTSMEKFLLISNGGLATFLLAAQTWLDLRPDLISVKAKLREFDKAIDCILLGPNGKTLELNTAVAASEALREEIRRTTNSEGTPAIVKSELRVLDERIKEAASALGNPRNAAQEDLQKWKIRWKNKTFSS